MNHEHLSPEEAGVLSGLVKNGHITRLQLPIGIAVGLDSMGPVRDPVKDALFPGTEEALDRFTQTLRDYQMMLIVATNGPDIEGEDILRALPLPVTAFAITEGGGKLISRDPSSGKFEYTVLADKNELECLSRLEVRVKDDPLMRAMMEDREPRRGVAPIRTPYDTNIVLTLPPDLGDLYSRINSKVPLEDVIPDIGTFNYVNRVLSYAQRRFRDAIQELNLGVYLQDLVKVQNRRIYVSPRHISGGALGETGLNKYGGVSLGSRLLHNNERYGFPRYTMERSVYVADKAVDITGEGQQVIGVSEKNMILGAFSYIGEDPNPDPGVNVIRLLPITHDQQTIYLAEVACRLAINVTMDNALPRTDTVEGVPILHIGSGLKALESITALYKQLHG